MQIDDMVAHFVGYETSTLYLKSAVCLRTFALSLALHWRPFFAYCDFMLCSLSSPTVHGRPHVTLSRGRHISSLKCIMSKSDRSERTKTVVIQGSRRPREKRMHTTYLGAEPRRL